MSPAGAALSAAVTAVLVAWIWFAARARRRRRERLIERFSEHAERLGVTARPGGRGCQLSHAATGGHLLVTDVVAAAARAERRGLPPESAWTASMSFALAPPSRLAGPLLLKLHGPRLLPRLAHPETAHLLERKRGVLVQRLPGEPFARLFGVETSAGIELLRVDQAREAGIDVRDVAGIAEAVLRQRLEPELAERLGRRAVLELRSDDGCGASRVLLLPELVGPGAAVAAVPRPDILLAAVPEAAGELRERARALDDGFGEPVSDTIFRVTAEGIAPLPSA